jgi:thioredoxin 1
MNKQLIHFTGEWCTPCKKMQPIIEDFLYQNPNIEYIKIDVDSNIEKLKEYNVASIPTFISKIDNEINARHVGAGGLNVLESLFYI